jgi:hypothetical protein
LGDLELAKGWISLDGDSPQTVSLTSGAPHVEPDQKDLKRVQETLKVMVVVQKDRLPATVEAFCEFEYEFVS